MWRASAESAEKSKDIDERLTKLETGTQSALEKLQEINKGFRISLI